MKDCPDDFLGDDYPYDNKWIRLASEITNGSIFTEEERNAITEAYTEIRRDKFTERVMKALAGDDKAEDENTINISSAQGAYTLSGSGLSSMWNSQKSHEEAHLTALQQYRDAQTKMVQACLEKEKTQSIMEGALKQASERFKKAFKQ